MTKTLRSVGALALASVLLASCSRPEPLPDPVVSADLLTFVAPPGDADPAPQLLRVGNGGSGSLPRPEVAVAYAGAAGWLEPTVAGDAAPYIVTVQAHPGALPPGTYRATLSIASAAGPAAPIDVPVTLEVPDPRVALGSDRLDFLAPDYVGDPPPQQVVVGNGGRGTLAVPAVAIRYVGAEGWLATEVSGTPAGYALTAATRSEGLESGTYTATLTVSAPGAAGTPPTVTVTLTVPPPRLETSTRWVDLDSAQWNLTTSGLIGLHNGGRGTLATPGCWFVGGVGDAWLRAEVRSDQNGWTAWVTPRPWLLAAGEHHATLRCEAPGAGPAVDVPITLRVAPPRLAVDGASTTSVEAVCTSVQEAWYVVSNVGSSVIQRPTVRLDPASAPFAEATVFEDGVNAYQVRLRLTPPGPTPPSSEIRFSVEVTGVDGSPREVVHGLALYEVADKRASVYSATGTRIRAQRGGGDPVPREAIVRADLGCLRAPVVDVTYQGASQGWLEAVTTSAGGLPEHRVALRSHLGQLPAGIHGALLAVREDGFTARSPLLVELEITDWEPLPPLYGGRKGLTASPVALRDVLVAGGRFENGLFAQDVLGYWDSLGQWVKLGTLSVPRAGHTATTLPDGRTLLVGGTGWDGTVEGTPLDSFEILTRYGEWSTGGRLPYPYSHHTTSLLESGDVLLAGGPRPATYVYGSASGFPQWEWAGDLAVAALDASAARLDEGTILLVGGVGVDAPGGQAGAPLAATQRWHRSSWSWVLDGEMGEARVKPGLARLPDGRILAAGGLGPDGAPLATAEIYDPATRSWGATGGTLNGHVAADLVVLPNGRIALVGGVGLGGVRSGEIELYDPLTGSWEVTGHGPMIPRDAASMTMESGRILFVGGRGADGLPSAEAYVW